jgi:hypothetical protein
MHFIDALIEKKGLNMDLSMSLRYLELTIDIGEFGHWNSYRKVHLLLMYNCNTLLPPISN